MWYVHSILPGVSWPEILINGSCRIVTNGNSVTSRTSFQIHDELSSTIGTLCIVVYISSFVVLCMCTTRWTL